MTLNMLKSEIVLTKISQKYIKSVDLTPSFQHAGQSILQIIFIFKNSQKYLGHWYVSFLLESLKKSVGQYCPPPSEAWVNLLMHSEREETFHVPSTPQTRGTRPYLWRASIKFNVCHELGVGIGPSHPLNCNAVPFTTPA